MTQSLFGLPEDADKTTLPPEGPDDFERARDAWSSALEREALRLRLSPNYNPADAEVRFSTSLPRASVEGLSVAIVGAGGIGNWQWRVLLGMGFRCVVVYDDDVVSVENVGPQAHNITDIGLPKVEAVRRAALAYRAGNILARNFRVETLGDITDDLGFMPDIVIGCTDSAEFRNGFIDYLHHRCLSTSKNIQFADPDRQWEIVRAALPDIWLDFRMALGDWHCFAIPLRRMALAGKNSPVDLCDLWDQYTRQAVFPPETAVQEPCTERAITYTGANVASYTGAFLHWWLTRGSMQLRGMESLRVYFGLEGRGVEPELDDVAFRWLMTYSSRDWEQGTLTWKEERLRASREAERKLWAQNNAKTIHFLESLVEEKVGHAVCLVDISEWRPGDYVYTHGKFSRCVSPVGMDSAPDDSDIPIMEESGKRVFTEWERIVMAFRPKAPSHDDVRYSAIPGETWVKGAIRHPALKTNGRLLVVGKVETKESGESLVVCGHDLMHLDNVAPCSPHLLSGECAAFSDLAVGDVIMLPVLRLYKWRITGKNADSLTALSLRPDHGHDQLIASCEAEMMLVERAREELPLPATSA